MLGVPGLRADKVVKLHKEFGITSLEALEPAARENELAGVKVWGPPCNGRFLKASTSGEAPVRPAHVHRAAELLASAEKHLEHSWGGAHPNYRRARFP